MEEQSLFTLVMTLHTSEKCVMQLVEFLPQVAQFIDYDKTGNEYACKIMIEGERMNKSHPITYRITDYRIAYHTLYSNN